MRAPQIIFLVLFGIELLMEAYKHGETKMEKHSIWRKLLNGILTLAVLYWGRFFS